MLSRIACVLFLALAPTLASPAHAAPDIRAIDPTLGDLRFGDGWDTIAKWLGKRLDKVYLPRIQRAVDGNEKARLRARRDQEIGLVQIAGLVARRIVPFVGEGTALAAGERVGLIRFGSRCDVYLPSGVEPAVLVGQRTVAGETVLADLAGTQARREGRAG